MLVTSQVLGCHGEQRDRSSFRQLTAERGWAVSKQAAMWCHHSSAKCPGDQHRACGSGWPGVEGELWGERTRRKTAAQEGSGSHHEAPPGGGRKEVLHGDGRLPFLS